MTTLCCCSGLTGKELSKGSDVRTFIFHTTTQEESIIALRIQNAPRQSVFGCAIGVSSVLSGVGPFKDLPIYSLPGSLADALQKIQNAPNQ